MGYSCLMWMLLVKSGISFLCWHFQWTTIINLNEQCLVMAENRVETHSHFAIKLHRMVFGKKGFFYFKLLVILLATLSTAPSPVCCNQSNTQSTAHVNYTILTLNFQNCTQLYWQLLVWHSILSYVTALLVWHSILT